VHERREWLTDLDAAIGDGDHGINLDRGLRAVVAALGDGADGEVLETAGRRIIAIVGGASGALYGRALIDAGAAVGGDAADAGAVGERAIGAAVEAIRALGRAAPGDKTMLDALLPALETLGSTRADPPAARLAAAAASAEAGASLTIPLVARKGRASYLGERSAGHMDPGAASAAMLVRCLADVAGRAGTATPARG
jgi:dihydroxyacetone kinase-like protein